jgi:hypothetical protein
LCVYVLHLWRGRGETGYTHNPNPPERVYPIDAKTP